MEKRIALRNSLQRTQHDSYAEKCRAKVCERFVVIEWKKRTHARTHAADAEYSVGYLMNRNAYHVSSDVLIQRTVETNERPIKSIRSIYRPHDDICGFIDLMSPNF